MTLMIIPESVEYNYYSGFVEVESLPENIRNLIESPEAAVSIEGDYSVRFEKDFDGYSMEITLGSVLLWTKDGRSFRFTPDQINKQDILEYLRDSDIDRWHQPGTPAIYSGEYD